VGPGDLKKRDLVIDLPKFDKPAESGLSTGAMIGIGVGVVAVALLLSRK
jgi:hypothetical protein